MGTFSGISTALSSLIAQRQALEVAGQNIANANTAGYTRQRSELQSIAAPAVKSMFSTPLPVGTGVFSAGVVRMGDEFLDARLRSATSTSYANEATAVVLERIESVIKEPSATGVSASLQKYWAAWEDVANNPSDSAVRTALLGQGRILTEQLATTYRNFESQWTQSRTEAETMVTTVNTMAQSVAALNNEIRGIVVSGGNANELIDKRSAIITELSSLVGATSSIKADGTVDVLVSGNQLVSGDKSNAIQINGSYVMSAAIEEPPTANQISLTWSNTGTPVTLKGGTLASVVTALKPTSLGGSISTAVDAINELAVNVATAVNTVHAAGTTLAASPNDTGVNFFSFTVGAPAALGITVAITDPTHIAASNGVDGAFDGSIADAISQLREGSTSPDSLWADFVIEFGVTTAAARTRADVAENSRATAETLQLSNASVDIDEEMTNMIMYQKAYQGAARVLTAMDEMLDTLINRTGVVGR